MIIIIGPAELAQCWYVMNEQTILPDWPGVSRVMNEQTTPADWPSVSEIVRLLPDFPNMSRVMSEQSVLPD